MTAAHAGRLSADDAVPLLAAEGLTVHRQSDRSPVLGPVDLSLSAGEILTVTGPSGAGKSTLLHALLDVLPSGLHRTGGTVRWRGSAVPQGRAARRWRRDRCAWLGQDPGAALHPLWRVDRLISEDTAGDRDSRAARVRAMLAALGLDPRLAALRAGQLSGGQAQRVALARALCADPALLVMDEPTSAVDRATADLIVEAVRSWSAGPGRALLLVTHDARLTAELGGTALHVEPAQAGSAKRRPVVPGAQPCPVRGVPAPVQEPVPARALVGSRATVPAAPPPTPQVPPTTVRPRPAAPRAARGRDLPPAPVLSLRGLSLARPDGVPLLDPCDLDLHAGAAVAVTGASGSGKTTLLYAVVGRRPASAGQLLLHGRSLPRDTRLRDRDQLRAVQLAGQSPLGELNPAHRAGRAVTRPLRVLHDLDRRAARARAAELIEAVGLDPALADRRPARLSGGQRQRVVLARALAAAPDVLLLDEPTSALDPAASRTVLDLVDRLRSGGLAVLTVTHDPAVAERADRVLILTGRRLVAEPSQDDGAPREERMEAPGAR
ncbi:ATP-binding cassette domain-containing protein [Streptomyces sp. 549]|uniref:ABC transporter ATP-binding protein n=1 Tax=Streptomyces sp. 549 TaxID=3049076 RepID=UPI0024C409AA|nr:ATP-binding cassette domain-containing protein [Streptomyces sp. 549]MDK1474487.1 ATP-binding cassette domain-containing protein [Streptomyces sp. 549]